MEDISYSLLCGTVTKTLICVNSFLQIELNTDLIDGEKLKNDEILNEYLNALVKANVLLPHGIDSPHRIISIDRLHSLDEGKTVIVLDISSNVQKGVDHLTCHVREIRNCGIDDGLSSEDSSSFIQQVPDIQSGPTLRWNSEMTSLLIKIRGDMDLDFVKAKYKFRLWEKVATKLNLLLNKVRVTAKDCDDKWRNIVATYRKNLEKLKFSCDNNIRWEYFSAMDNILKGTRELTTFPDCLTIRKSPSPLIPDTANTEIELITEPFEIINVGADPVSADDVIMHDEDEFLLNSVITRTDGGEKRTWTTEQCLTLICLKHQADSRFKEYHDSEQLWQQLVVQMNEKFFSEFTGFELETAWSHFNLQYELNLENLKSKGVNTVRWKYFAVMDEIRGGTREISEICVPRPGEALVDEFRKLQSTTKPLRISERNVSYLNYNGFSSSTSWDCQDESDGEDNTLSSSSGVVWTKDMIKALISWKKNIEQNSLKSQMSKRKQWIYIARKFRNEKTVMVTEEACEEKWRSLVRMYRKNLNKFRKRENSVISWPYFWKMREILGNSVLQKERPFTPPVIKNTTRLNGLLSTDRLGSSCGALNDEFVEFKRGFLDGFDNPIYKLLTSVEELKDNQNKILKEIVDIQRKKIEEVQAEQRCIKALLLELLRK